MEINGKQTIRIMCILLVCLVLLSGIAVAETVRFDPAQITVKPGETATVDLVLADAPGGLSGYRAITTIDSSGVAGITAVTFPPWAEFTGAEGVPGARVTITGVDLNRQVEKDSKDVILATLTINGISEGNTTLVFEDAYYDTDLDNRIIPDMVNSTISVTTNPAATTNTSSNTTTTAPTSTAATAASGRSGSSSGSSGSVTTAVTTTVSPVSQGNTGQDTTNPGTLQTQETAEAQAPEVTTLGTTNPPVSEGTPGPGIPFLSTPGILAFAISLVLLAVWFRKREGGN